MTRRKKAPKKQKGPPRDLSRRQEAIVWRVEDPADDGARIDRVLMARLSWRSRSSIAVLLAEGKVRCNEQVVTRKSTRVRVGDELAVAVPPPEEEERHEELGLSLVEAMLFEDEHLLALAKPPGLVVHPVGRVRVNTLIQALHWAFLHGPLAREGRPPDRIPRICHRLDKDTSGVLVLAKSLAARTALQHAFDAHDALEKVYRGVVVGRPELDEGQVDLPIGPDEGAEVGLMQTVRPDGAPSSTSWWVERRFPRASELRFQIHTGRQHQIRVHAARALGHPILLDALYGDGRVAWPDEQAPVISRQALHAERLALAHPITGERLDLRAPLPADLRALLDGLADQSP